MCKRAGLLAGWDFSQKRVYITRGSCKQWDCPECAEKLREQWVLRAKIGTQELLQEGLRVDFVTITSHENLKTFSQCHYVFHNAWSKLYAALKRKTPRLEYFIVPEKHKDGRMHIHAIWSAGVTQKWLKDACRSRGLGYQAKVIEIKDAIAAPKYVTKYIGKDLGEDVPKGFRRIRVSAGWKEIPKPNTQQSTLSWEYIDDDRMLDGLMRKCYADDFEIIDAKTKEFWDYEPAILR